MVAEEGRRGQDGRECGGQTEIEKRCDMIDCGSNDYLVLMYLPSRELGSGQRKPSRLPGESASFVTVVVVVVAREYYRFSADDEKLNSK
jgi:hypothetical protein